MLMCLVMSLGENSCKVKEKIRVADTPPVDLFHNDGSASDDPFAYGRTCLRFIYLIWTVPSPVLVTGIIPKDP